MRTTRHRYHPFSRLVARKAKGPPEPGLDIFVDELDAVTSDLITHVTGKSVANAALEAYINAVDVADAKVDACLRHTESYVDVEALDRRSPYAADARGGHAYFRSDYDRARLRWRLIEGEVELAPELRTLPTFGHTPGHQSLVLADAPGATRGICPVIARYLDWTPRERPTKSPNNGRELGDNDLEFRDDGLEFRANGWEFRDDGWEFRDDGWEVRDDGLEFRDDGWEFRDDGLEFRGDSWEFRGDGWEFRGDGWEFRGDGLEFRGDGLGFRDNGFEFRDNGFEFRDDGWEFRGDGLEFRGDGLEFRGDGWEFRGDGWEFRDDGCRVGRGRACRPAL